MGFIMTSVDLGGFFPQEKPCNQCSKLALHSHAGYNDEGTHETGEWLDWLGKSE